MVFVWKEFHEEIQNILRSCYCKTIEISALTSLFQSLLFISHKYYSFLTFPKEKFGNFSSLLSGVLTMLFSLVTLTH